MGAGKSGVMKRLEEAVRRLSTRLSRENIEVCAPLYANTFALATVARLAAEEARTASYDKIAINSFDWNWSKDPDNPPPFISSRPLQLFFATASEFSRIHAAGISFFAVPASVFYPRYVFVGLRRGEDPEQRKYQDLVDLIKMGLSTKSASKEKATLDGKPFGLIWVSDIPEQAEILARRVHEFLQMDDLPGQVTNFWKDRPLGDALRTIPNADDAPEQLKAFIWSGPLASVARGKSKQPIDGASRGTGSPLRLRDPDLPSICIDLPSLTKAFSNEDINDRHALYCCVGYKETGLLEDYYTSGKYLKDVPWDIGGLKFEAMRSTTVGALAWDLAEFFSALFAAAHDVPEPDTNDAGKPIDDLFQSFVSDFDKFCRTLNPVAQLYTREIYAACLRDHHDSEAFASLFP